MIARIRPYVAPAFLFLCLVLGGSAQGYWGNATLRLGAIILTAWALLEPRDKPLPRSLKQLLLLLCAAVVLIIVQLIPLPTGLWAALPGRQSLLDGIQVLGISPAAMPTSLAPYDTIATGLALLPAIGMLAAIIGIRGYSAIWLAAALVGGAATGVVLGILQVTSANPMDSFWYIYRQSNFGVATGFFANSNHMAGLLLAAIPFIAALGVTVREQSRDLRMRSAVLALVGGGLVVVILGLILNGSLAGYGLGLPVVLASLLMLFGAGSRVARAALIAIALSSIIALAMLWTSPISREATTSVSTRQEMVANSIDLVGKYGLTGSGLGTFDKVYRMGERPDKVDAVFVNHVHNDYLELAIETGIPGIILMLCFLAWWGRSVVVMARSPAADQFAYAGAIASAALLFHSVVDYPLRTAAISAVFAMCLALIVQSRRSAASDTDIRPVRHVVIA